MPTLIGTNAVNSLSERYVLPVIVDQIYNGNALFWRLNQANKKAIQGGTHVEAPMMYAEFTNGGPYQGYDLLDIAPNDTVKNGGWDIKQYYVPVTVDGLTLTKANSPDAVVNLLKLQWEQARMQMASNLGDGLYSDGVTNAKEIFGLKGAVDAGGVATSYAGLVRAQNTWLNSQVDSTTATLTLTAARSMVSSCTRGGHSPSLILSRKEQYDRMWALLIANQRYASDNETLTNAGFANLAFDHIPWVIDDKVFDGPNASNSAILFLNEDVIQLAIFGNTDFTMEDFQKPVNQNAMVGKLYWDGELMVLNTQVQGKMTNVSA
jgi:hypothetical protein